jgi:CelD/BcsL family acetyltransferase involved in cellulose biosynthesis
MSSKLAKTLRNAQRRLAREGITFSWKGPGEVEVTDLERLYQLNHLRRSDTGDKPVFDDPLRRAFHERLLQWGEEDGGTAVMVAARDDKIVGVLYGFRWQSSFAYYQTGWDPEYRQLSLGSVLVQEAMKECARQGIEIFDFLRGAEDYKYRFGATDVIEGSFTIGRSFGLAAIRAVNRLRGQPRSIGG